MASTNASTRARASRATSRGTVRDSARQCGTVFEDGKGRSSSRRAGKKVANSIDIRSIADSTYVPLRIRVAPCRDRRGAEAYGFFPTRCNNDFYSRPSLRISADSRVNSAIRTRPFSVMKAATRSISSRET